MNDQELGRILNKIKKCMALSKSSEPLEELLGALDTLRRKDAIANLLTRPISLDAVKANEETMAKFDELRHGFPQARALALVAVVDDPRGGVTTHLMVSGASCMLDHAVEELADSLNNARDADIAAMDEDDGYPVCEGCGKRHPQLTDLLKEFEELGGDVRFLHDLGHPDRVH